MKMNENELALFARSVTMESEDEWELQVALEPGPAQQSQGRKAFLSWKFKQHFT